MITIVGGSGFIGKRLSNSLYRDNVKFINVDENRPIEYKDLYIPGDVRGIQNLEENLKGTSQIINLAAKHQDNVKPIDLYYSVNVDGARQVTSLAEKLKIRKIIFTSSAAVYGIHNEVVNESSSFRPFNHYGKSKLQAEQIYLDWQKRTDGCLIMIRPTVVFGEENRGNVYNLLTLLNDGKFRMVGNGHNRKSMAYVGNIAAFLKFCVEEINEGLHIYNYSDGPDLTMNELVHAVSKQIGQNSSSIKVPYLAGMVVGYGFDAVSAITGKNYPVSAVRIKKFCANTQFSSEKVDNTTGFQREFSLQEGLERTITHEFGKLTSAS